MSGLTTEEPSKEPPPHPESKQDADPNAARAASDTEAGFLGFLIIGAVLYFVFVFRELPEGVLRFLITGAVALLALAVWLAAKKWASVARRLPTAYDLLIFASVVVLIVLAAIYLTTKDKVILLKVLALFYFSLLPALLYLQFSSGRTLAVWRDYVSNLYKLQIDDPANLPRPPTLSPFYAGWKIARDRAWDERTFREPRSERAKVDRRLEWANQYRVKFRDLFGEIPPVEQPKSVLSLRSAHKLQVVLATVLMTLGWTFVVQPESVYGGTITPDFELANLPVIPSETFAFAFLGAYFYVLQMLVRRYFQNDLKATAYINATMRIVIVILLVWVVDPLLADRASASQTTRSAVAFVIGVFPTVGWQFLQQTVRRIAGKTIPSLEPKHKLADLDGLNIWYESRLLEVGVEDMQNLATTDIVDLMLNTRIPVDRIVDWIDQSLLYVRVTEEKERQLLRSYGIRTATDLDDALDDKELRPTLVNLLNLVWKQPFVLPAYKDDGTPVHDGLPSRILSLQATLKTERNLQHVRAWKGYKVGATAETRPAQPAPTAQAQTDDGRERPPEALPSPA